MEGRYVYATLLTCDSYLAGVLVLSHSLHQTNSKHPLIVMVTPSLPTESRKVLQKHGILLREVDPVFPPLGHRLAESDSRFADTWAKLRVFSLLEYERVVFLDSDMVVRRNMDELFHLKLMQDEIAAVHVCACNPFRFEHYPIDWIPKNCPHSVVRNPLSPPPRISNSAPRPYQLFNSGTMVLRPSRRSSEAIFRVLDSEDMVKHFVFPDQDLLAFVFRDKWTPLPWYYNAMRTMREIHQPLWDDEEVRCVHYILPDKPWASRNTVNNPGFQTVHRWWWEAFEDMLQLLAKTDPEGAQWVLAQVDYA